MINNNLIENNNSNEEKSRKFIVTDSKIKKIDLTAKKRKVLQQCIEEGKDIYYRKFYGRREQFIPKPNTEYRSIWQAKQGLQNCDAKYFLGNDGSVLEVDEEDNVIAKRYDYHGKDGEHLRYKLKFDGEINPKPIALGVLMCLVFPDKVQWISEECMTKKIIEEEGLEAFQSGKVDSHHTDGLRKNNAESFEGLRGEVHGRVNHIGNDRSREKDIKFMQELAKLSNEEVGKDTGTIWLTGNVYDKEGKKKSDQGERRVEALTNEQSRQIFDSFFSKPVYFESMADEGEDFTLIPVQEKE